MRLLITGANGLLGQKLLAFTRERPEVELYATGRGTNRNVAGDYKYLSCDLCRREEVRRLIAKVRPEVIIHTAAMTQVDECELNREACYESNVKATEFLLEESKSYHPFFLFLSTDFVFDGENGPYAEEDTPNPVSYYGESKLAGEQLVIFSGIDYAIARTILVYGIVPHMSRSNIVLWVRESLQKGKPIKVVTDQWRTPTLADDLALGCFLIVSKRARGIYHLSGSETLTPYEMAVKTAGYFGLDTSLIEPVNASTFTQPAKRPPRTGFIIKKARKELSFNPKSFEEGLDFMAREIKT